MELAVDANILISALISTEGATFDLMFNDNLAKGRFVKDGKDTPWYEWVTAKIGQFKNAHHHQFHETPFKQLIKKYMSFSQFREIWNEVRSHTYTQMLDRYEKVSVLAESYKKESRIDFNVFTVPYIRDKRLDIVLYTPSNSKTFKSLQTNQ